MAIYIYGIEIENFNKECFEENDIKYIIEKDQLILIGLVERYGEFIEN
ncbi:MAG: hypothetical protein ACRDCB_06770 [Clostridium sp.]